MNSWPPVKHTAESIAALNETQLIALICDKSANPEENTLSMLRTSFLWHQQAHPDDEAAARQAWRAVTEKLARNFCGLAAGWEE